MTKSCGKNVLSAKQVKKDLEHLHDTYLVKLGAVSDQLFSMQSLKASLSRLFETGELGEVIDDPNYFSDGVCLEKKVIEFKNLSGFTASEFLYDHDNGYYHIESKVRFLKHFDIKPNDELEFIPRVVFDYLGRPHIVAFDVKVRRSDALTINPVMFNSDGYAFGRTPVKGMILGNVKLGYFQKRLWSREKLLQNLNRLLLLSPGEIGRPVTGRSKERWRTVDKDNTWGELLVFEIKDYNDETYVVEGLIELSAKVPLTWLVTNGKDLVFAPRVSFIDDLTHPTHRLICLDLILG